MSDHNKDAPRVITFEKCPMCGWTETYCGELARQEKARGHMRQELNFFFKVEEGTCYDAEVMERLPIGTTVPSYVVCYDICANPECGILRVVKIIERDAIKQPKIDLPNQWSSDKGQKLPPFFSGGNQPIRN